MDRMKLLLQVDSTARGLTVREGWGRMAAEGEPSHSSLHAPCEREQCKSEAACWIIQGAQVAASLKAPGECAHMRRLTHGRGLRAVAWCRAGTMSAFFRGQRHQRD